MEITGKMITIQNSPRRPGDPAQLVADVSKIKKELAFAPQYSDINTIISTAWTWHKKVHNLETKSPVAQSMV
jgi:UDP-glucose 4-epimerase